MSVPPLSREQREAEVAIVMDAYHYTPAQIADLTDYQVRALCFHVRDEHGGVKVPPPRAGKVLTEDEHIAAIRRAGRKMGLSSAKIAQKVEELRQRYAAKRGEASDASSSSSGSAGAPVVAGSAESIGRRGKGRVRRPGRIGDEIRPGVRTVISDPVQPDDA